MVVQKLYPGKVNRSKLRVPSIPFHLKNRPWQIQPFFIHPVLPGESVNGLLWKANTVSDPVANRLMGWHQEWNLFYVRLRDLFPASDVKSIFTNPEENLSALYSAADPKYFHYYGVNYAKEATRLIVEHYFRSDEETPDDATIDGLWAQSMGTDNWLDSALVSADMAEAEVQVDVADGSLELTTLERAQRTYELLKMGALTDMDYDDFIRTYGVRVPSAEQEGKPKLLRTIRNWQMPVNHIDETSGAATTAVYFKSDERHDKDMFVKEPGFLIGMVSYKPKVYLGNVKGSVTGIMDSLLEWLPAVMRDDPTSSMIEVSPTTGPLANQTTNYQFDLRDFLLYGEQFTNVDPASVNMATVALPSAALQKRYPSLADAQSVFVAAGAEDTAQFLETDGMLNIKISGAITDTTPSVSRLSV